jgi:hypothetical protein
METIETVEKVNVSCRIQIAITKENGNFMSAEEVKAFLYEYAGNPQESIIHLIEQDKVVIESLYFSDSEKIV